MNRSTNRTRLSLLPVSPMQVAIASRPDMGKRGLGRCIVAFLLLCALVISACNSTTEPAEEAVETDSDAAAALEPAARNGMHSAAPAMTIDPAGEYYAIFKTDRGDMRVRLFADQAPATVNNFVFLARDGFYNDTHFHRVLENFMAQGGDPTGSGAGGPGYEFQDEIVASLQFDRARPFGDGERRAETRTAVSFFITLAETPWLNGKPYDLRRDRGGHGTC